MKKYLIFIFAFVLIVSCSKKPQGLPTSLSSIPNPSSLKNPAQSLPKTAPNPSSISSKVPTGDMPKTPQTPSLPKSTKPSLPNAGNINRPNAKVFDTASSAFEPLLDGEDHSEDFVNSNDSGLEVVFADEQNDYFDDIIPEKEVEVPTIDDGDIYFYLTIGDDKPQESYRIVDALMTYNVDPDKKYLLPEIISLYYPDTDDVKKPSAATPPTFEELKAQLAKQNANDENIIKSDVINTFKVDYERQRRREAILADGDFYKIVITNEATSKEKIRRSLGMMTLDTYISSVNRVKLKEEEEMALYGATFSYGAPIDFTFSFSPYLLAGVKKDTDVRWTMPYYTMLASLRAHYKFRNETKFMISGGFRGGLYQSLYPLVMNVPIFAEIGLGIDNFDIYAGVGAVYSNKDYGGLKVAAEAEGYYNFFFGSHSSFFVGVNAVLAISLGGLSNGKTFDFSRMFLSPITGYKFSIDSVRHDKVVSFVDRDWYDIVILDPVKVDMTDSQETKTLKKFFVEVQYSGSPFDVNVFVTPYSPQLFITESLHDPYAPYNPLEDKLSVSVKMPLYALNIGISGHYKLKTFQDKSVGIGFRLDWSQSYSKTQTFIPFLIDANLVMLNALPRMISLELHAGIGGNFTHVKLGGPAIGAKVGGSANLPLTLNSFITLGLDVDVRIKLDFSKKEMKDMIKVPHLQIDPFIGYKHSFDKFERLVFDTETGYATDECYIIDIVNDNNPKEEVHKTEGKNK